MNNKQIKRAAFITSFRVLSIALGVLMFWFAFAFDGAPESATASSLFLNTVICVVLGIGLIVIGSSVESKTIVEKFEI